VAVVILHVHKYEKKKVTRKFMSGGLHERHVIANWKYDTISFHILVNENSWLHFCLHWCFSDRPS